MRRIAAQQRIGESPDMRFKSLTGRTTFSSEKNLKWQICLCYRLSTCARRIRHVRACWARECVTSLNTSNSTKTQNVTIRSFSLLTSPAHKERLARETRLGLGL